MIQVTVALQQALRNGTATRHAFVELDHPLDVVRLWTGTGTMTWNGNDWLGVGALGAVGEVSDTKDVQAHDLSLQISGVNPMTVTLADGQVRGRSMTMWSRWLDNATGAWFPDSAILFGGMMDTVTTAESGGQAIMTLVCRSPLFNWSDSPKVYYSNEEWQALYPGDTGFDRMQNIPTQNAAGWELT